MTMWCLILRKWVLYRSMCVLLSAYVSCTMSCVDKTLEDVSHISAGEKVRSWEGEELRSYEVRR